MTSSIGIQLQIPGFGLGTVTNKAGDYYRIESNAPLRPAVVYRKKAAPAFKPTPCCLLVLTPHVAYERASAWIAQVAA